MSVALLESLPKSRLKALLDHFGQIEDPREPWRVAHPLPEVLLLVVCGTICDCEDSDLMAEWAKSTGGAAPLSALSPWRAWRALAHAVDEPPIRACSRPPSRPGCGRPGPIAPSSWPSTARPRGAATIARPARRRCIWSEGT